jgi:hypothetical protein
MSYNLSTSIVGPQPNSQQTHRCQRNRYPSKVIEQPLIVSYHIQNMLHDVTHNIIIVLHSYVPLCI